MVQKMSKHDQYLEQLKHELAPNYDTIQTNVILEKKRRNRVRRVAEVDILARKGNTYDVYEVKCSRRIVKAREQIRKIRKYIPKGYKIKDTFLYWGGASLLIPL